ncbi:unnamed protein product [Discula destructiva]
MVSRAAIYFDGSLPPSKREERHSRSRQRSAESQKYFLNNISGFRAGEDDRQVPRRSRRSMPDPPFFVPSILETLRSHQKYGLITHLVPGEADPYCANDVQQDGGMILTSDSDLLLYDLGSTGGVVFLHELQFDYQADPDDTDEVKVIEAPLYKQSTLCKRLSLEPGQLGMLQVGFETKTRPRHGHVLPASQWACLEDEHAAAFAMFASEYQQSPSLQNTTEVPVALLDPRIAEFVMDWQGIRTTKNHPQEQAQDLTVWLPFLIDRWDQESAWNMSTTTRQLAYSLCRGSERSDSTVMEYRRTMSETSAGQAVALVERSETAKGIEDLIAYVDRCIVEGDKSSTGLRWITICLSLEIGYAAQEGKRSNALELWRQAARSDGLLNSGTWDAVHLAALVQGTLYSFRMLHQVLNSGKKDLLPSGQAARLKKCLSSLPSIAEFPSVADMRTLFAQLHHGGHLGVLSEVTGCDDVSFGAETGETSKKRKKKERKQEQKQRDAQSSRASSNPFDALSVSA